MESFFVLLAALSFCVFLLPSQATVANAAGIETTNDTLAIIPAKDGTRTLDSSNGVDVHAQLLDGDSFVIKNNEVTLVNASGTNVAKITVTLPVGKKVVFNSTTSTLRIVNSSSFGLMSANGCTNNKWAQWLVRVSGDLLVCTPAAIAATGVSAGVAEAFVAAGCAGGVEALVTWISC
ncbi:hypothetical protein [Galliscardovia ingluviei]|uniref:hypothetical protein n=1 Tax=Galliscardovia ingluviei TaxID=1769422 RepID=UPI001664BB39|nr:hypothetical protein [Galliscardovia ingluviei]